MTIYCKKMILVQQIVLEEVMSDLVVCYTEQ